MARNRLARLLRAMKARVRIRSGMGGKRAREEMRPKFSFQAHGGPSHTGSLLIQADGTQELIGCWTKTVPVAGGQYYRFSALRRTEGIDCPRRCGVARMIWRGERGKP